ncbi:MAG: pilus assembly protein [Chloroflexota bacterium]|nr:pilus assembly protein [Chloroflexota bacterium]
MRIAHWTKARREQGERGQSLVEFALIFPIFILLFIGLIEFSVTLSVMLNVNYASRDSALLSAEVGDGAGADCLILQRLDAALGGGAAHHSGIQQVRIYWADANGSELAANAYDEGGVGTTCTLADGSTATVPYTPVPGGLNYIEDDRCTVLAGCALDSVGRNHPGLDTIGVAITFHHDWLTPLPNLVQVPPNGVTFDRSNTMRMEPVL